jgi:putative transcriptional regulator
VKEANQIEPQQGAILISEPFLPDSNFKRTVIMLCEHNDEGTFGLIINKPMSFKVNEAIEDFPELDMDLYSGGPVENNTLHFLHSFGDSLEGSIEIMDGLYWGGNFEILKILIANGEISSTEVRFFLGYSGWSSGQLDDELKEKSWIVAKSKPEFVFQNNDEGLWREILKSMGGQYQIMSNFPESPLLN